MLIIRHSDVDAVLAGCEDDVLDLVTAVYRRHDEGLTAVPHSTFLRFPGDDRNRIIGLPAYVGGSAPSAGLKWISSFPDNIHRGYERASAAIILNSMDTGRPEALVEGSVISAKRTAASAAVAARLLTAEPEPGGVTLYGCGVINREILRFLTVALPSITSVTLFDADRRRAESFPARAGLGGRLRFTVAAKPRDALAAHRLVSIATTASSPHLGLDRCRPDTTVLGVSLRDIEVPAILAAHNIVDDVDHVCRERTSVHLAEQEAGHRRFVDATIGGLLRREKPWRRDAGRTVVFSPFGLGALDIALADLVAAAVRRSGMGTLIDDFSAPPQTPAPVSTAGATSH